MGIWTSAYVAYGVQIPDTDVEMMEAGTYPAGVGYLHAGGYDREMTFITAYCESADIGDVQRFRPQDYTADTYAMWNAGIRDAAASIGVELTEDPGWFVVPDQS